MMNWIKTKLKHFLVITGFLTVAYAAGAKDTQTVFEERVLMSKNSTSTQVINIPDGANWIKLSADRGTWQTHAEVKDGRLVPKEVIEVTAYITAGKATSTPYFRSQGGLVMDDINDMWDTDSSVTSSIPKGTNRTAEIVVEAKEAIETQVTISFQ